MGNLSHKRNSSNNFIMIEHALADDYMSDGSDNSDISQSYGAYLYDANYKSKMRMSHSFQTPKLKEWDSELSMFSDSEHLPIAGMEEYKNNVVSTVVQGDDDSKLGNHVANISGFDSSDF